MIMASWALLILSSLWVHSLIETCEGEELSREAVLSWFRTRVLDGLGLEEPPVTSLQLPGGDAAQPPTRRMHQRALRTSRTAWVNRRTSPAQETSEIILFPSFDSSCARSDSAPGGAATNHFTYYFQPSVKNQDTVATSAHFWFYAGKDASENTSAPLFILTSAQQFLQAAEGPSKRGSDGWTTYYLDQNLLSSLAKGPFLLQVRCLSCQCRPSEPDKMPFLHVHTQPVRGSARSARHAPVTIPWSPSAINLLQRPSVDRPRHSDCHRAQIEISFEELGWDNWIVHPKVLTFYYCHGNCSAWDRTASILGITQCCAPVPGTMKSLRITTTSDGGYSFKYEILPNIIPEECTCI